MPHDEGVRTYLVLTPWRLCAGAAVAAALVVMMVTPWSSTVAPWAQTASGAGIGADLQGKIDRYEAASAVPLILAWLSPVVVAIVWFLLSRMGTQGLRRWIHTRSGVIAAVALLVVSGIPGSLWLASVRREFGLNLRSGPQDFLVAIMAGAMTIAVAVAVVSALAWIVGRWPNRWWIVLAPLAAAVALMGSWALPLFGSHADRAVPPAVAVEVDVLSQAGGVDAPDLRTAVMSQWASTVNAVVTGYGASSTITYHDGLFVDLTAPEVRAISAHEVAHIVSQDVWWASVEAALVCAAAVAAIAGALSSRRIRRWSGATDGVGVVVAMTPFLALATTALLAISVPVVATVSRPIELRADHEALELLVISGLAANEVRASDELASALRTMTSINLGGVNPPQWRYALFGTHPSLAQRLGVLAAADANTDVSGDQVPATRTSRWQQPN